MHQTHLQRQHGQRGFSLLEVIVVIGLISMMTGLVIANFDKLIPAFEHTPLEVKFRQAVREARIQAATQNRTIYLRFNPTEEAFEIVEQATTTDEAEASVFADSPYYNPDVEVDFLPIPAVTHRDINRFGGVDSIEPVPRLAFHPSGSATPAYINFKWRDGREAQLTLDPFSSGPLADKELFQ